MVRVTSTTRARYNSALAISDVKKPISGKTTNHKSAASGIVTGLLSPILKLVLLVSIFSLAINAQAQFPPSFVYANNQTSAKSGVSLSSQSSRCSY